MSELVCNECGTLNDASDDVCALCGDPLGDEREQKKKRSLLVLIPTAVVVTVGLYGVLGFAAQLFIAFESADMSSHQEPDFFAANFWIIYTVIWAIMLGFSAFYAPKDSYDFGGRHGNPLSWRDDRDRRHATLGFLLFPFHIVRGLWGTVFRRLFGTADDEGPPA